MSVTWDFLTGNNSHKICHPMQFPNAQLPQSLHTSVWRAWGLQCSAGGYILYSCQRYWLMTFVKGMGQVWPINHSIHIFCRISCEIELPHPSSHWIEVTREISHISASKNSMAFHLLPNICFTLVTKCFLSTPKTLCSIRKYKPRFIWRERIRFRKKFKPHWLICVCSSM
jgi:hypothetical protein